MRISDFEGIVVRISCLYAFSKERGFPVSGIAYQNKRMDFMTIVYGLQFFSTIHMIMTIIGFENTDEVTSVFSIDLVMTFRKRTTAFPNRGLMSSH